MGNKDIRILNRVINYQGRLIRKSVCSGNTYNKKIENKRGAEAPLLVNMF